MDISINEQDSQVLIKITGSVKVKDAEILETEFQPVLKKSAKPVALDLTNVLAMSSLGIGKIIFLHRQLESQNRDFEVSGISKNLLTLFTTMNLDKVFNIRKV